MHPPLDRPHPDCQQEIVDLQECHATKKSIFNIWACDQVKFALDRCFKKEKARLLEEMNKDMVEKRRQEEEAFANAAGHGLSFEDYLKQDPAYQSELEKAKRRNNNKYQTTAQGGHTV